MEGSWIKRPVWGPSFENGDLELPETTLQRLPGHVAYEDRWYVIACGSNEGEVEVIEQGLTLDEAKTRI